LFELQVLGDFLHTGSLAAGNVWRPTAQTGKTELEADEVAEVVYLEVVPPVKADGTAELLESINLILDGKKHPYININGTQTYLMAPPKTNIFGNLVALGVPMVNAAKMAAPLYEGTCPKYKNDLKIEVTAGTGGITESFRVRLWGYRYKVDQLASAVAPMLGGAINIEDKRRGRTLSIYKTPVSLTKEGWTQLPGGLDQAMPKINPLIRYAFNANATTVNIPYEFRYDIGNVNSEDENLRFDYDRYKNALVLKGLGVRAPANLAETFISINGEEHPDGRFPTTQYLNPIHFGNVHPILSENFYPNLYYPIPKLDKPYLIWNEIGYIACVDNGSQVAAGDIIVAINGTIIEMAD